MRGVILWHGQPVPFRPGESAGSALMRAGVLALRRRMGGQPRGLFCGIGQCQNCLIRHGGRTVEACLLPCTDGMRLEPEGGEDA